MTISITIPRLGWSMEEGTFAGWLKQDGDRVAPGEPLYVLESDKAAEEVEALDGGVLRIPPDGPKRGDKVQVGQVLAFLVAEGEGVPAASPPAKRAITPRARRVARELGVEWAGLQGSGRNGRIRERDVRAVAPAGPAGRLIPHTTLRRTIAERMVAGVTRAAPVTLTTRADVTNLVNLRDQFKAATPPDDLVPGYTDLVVRLTAAALRQHPMLQAQYRDDGLFVPERIDIAIAVDTDGGLLVPVVRGADRLTLREVTARSRELIDRARASRLTAEEMAGATFTVTNLGGLGVDAFTPIIHLPQGAVLGVGRIVREPVVVGDKILPRDVITLSLTFDHRVLDGAAAARFLGTLRDCLEQPAPWLIP